MSPILKPNGILYTPGLPNPDYETKSSCESAPTKHEIHYKKRIDVHCFYFWFTKCTFTEGNAELQIAKEFLTWKDISHYFKVHLLALDGLGNLMYLHVILLVSMVENPPIMKLLFKGTRKKFLEREDLSMKLPAWLL